MTSKTELEKATDAILDLFSCGWITVSAYCDAVAERVKQIGVKGFTYEHDDAHIDGSLVDAAICYAKPQFMTWDGKRAECPTGWPWDKSYWKPTTKRQDLIKAIALLLAEVERIDRSGVHE